MRARQDLFKVCSKTVDPYVNLLILTLTVKVLIFSIFGSLVFLSEECAYSQLGVQILVE